MPTMNPLSLGLLDVNMLQLIISLPALSGRVFTRPAYDVRTTVGSPLTVVDLWTVTHVGMIQWLPTGSSVVSGV